MREDARPTVAGKAIQIYGYVDLLFTQQQGNSGVAFPGSINPLIELRVCGMRPWVRETPVILKCVRSWFLNKPSVRYQVT